MILQYVNWIILFTLFRVRIKMVKLWQIVKDIQLNKTIGNQLPVSILKDMLLVQYQFKKKKEYIYLVVVHHMIMK